jgi:hypothetical protein
VPSRVRPQFSARKRSMTHTFAYELCGLTSNSVAYGQTPQAVRMPPKGQVHSPRESGRNPREDR